MKRTSLFPLMLIALLFGSLGCTDLPSSNDGDELAVVADVSLDRPLTGVALVTEGSNLCFTTQRCAGWCEWEDRDTCPFGWCVKMPPPDDPPPPADPDNRALTLGARGPSCALVAGSGLSFDLQGRVAVNSLVVASHSASFVPAGVVARLGAGGSRCVSIQETDCPCWCEWEDRYTTCPPNCCVKDKPNDDPPPPADPPDTRFLTGTPAGLSMQAPGGFDASMGVVLPDLGNVFVVAAAVACDPGCKVGEEECLCIAGVCSCVPEGPPYGGQGPADPPPPRELVLPGPSLNGVRFVSADSTLGK